MSGITRNWATKNSDKVVGRHGSNSPAGQCCAVNLAFKNSVTEESPARRLDSSHSGSSSQVGNTGFFLRLGQLESFRSELFRIHPKHIVWLVCAHAGHTAVIILILSYKSSLKLRPRPQWVLPNLKPVTNGSNKPATRLQSLSLKTAILNSKSLKIAVGDKHLPVPGRGTKVVEQGRASIVMP